MIGGCQRLAHLRHLGRENDIDTRSQIMFDNGFANEDQIFEVMKKGGYSMLREEEIPIKWHTTNDTPVTGRPDIVFVDDKKAPVLGLELKQVASIWTARRVLLQGIPKTANVVQAAHYSMKLDVPFYLVYTSRVNWEIPWRDWFHRDAKGHPAVDERDGVPSRIRPFHVSYALVWKDGKLFVGIEGEEPRETIITKDGIESFYNHTAEMQTDEDLGPVPQGVDVWGNADEKEAPCKYCEFKSLCSSDVDYSEFIVQTKGEHNE